MLQDAGTTWTTTPRPRIGPTRWRVKVYLLAGTVLTIQNMERTMSSKYNYLLYPVLSCPIFTTKLN